jgi:hypothetical protein
MKFEQNGLADSVNIFRSEEFCECLFVGRVFVQFWQHFHSKSLFITVFSDDKDSLRISKILFVRFTQSSSVPSENSGGEKRTLSHGRYSLALPEVGQFCEFSLRTSAA